MMKLMQTTTVTQPGRKRLANLLQTPGSTRPPCGFYFRPLTTRASSSVHAVMCKGGCLLGESTKPPRGSWVLRVLRRLSWRMRRRRCKSWTWLWRCTGSGSSARSFSRRRACVGPLPIAAAIFHKTLPPHNQNLDFMVQMRLQSRLCFLHGPAHAVHACSSTMCDVCSACLWRALCFFDVSMIACVCIVGE